MEIRIPKHWVEIADRMEQAGIEVAVIGRDRRVAPKWVVQITVKVPRSGMSLSKQALRTLGRNIESQVKSAVRRARSAKRTEVKGVDFRRRA